MSLLFNFRPLVINPQLAERIGLNEAIVLQQLKYWLNETASGVDHDGRRWVYNSVEQWQRQFPFWSPETVKRTLSSLQKRGLVMVEKLAKAKHDQTNHYTINYQSDALIDQVNLTQSEQVNLPQSVGSDCPDLHTEITTKTTSHISDVSESISFDRFWSLYPRKVNKVPAEKAWAKLKVDRALFAVIAKALAKQASSIDWLKSGGQFIPHPASWLNGKRWEDEVSATAGARPSAYNGLPQHTPEMYQEVPDGQPNF